MAATLLARRQNRLAGLSIVKFVFVLTYGMSSNRRATEVAARNLRAQAYVVAIGKLCYKKLHKRVTCFVRTAVFCRNIMYKYRGLNEMYELSDRCVYYIITLTYISKKIIL